MKLKSTSLLTALALTATAFLAQGQDPNADPNRQRGGGPRNYEDFRKMMSDRLKAALKVSDDEWGVIQPLLDKVTTKQRDAGSSRYSGSSRGAGGPPGGGTPPGGSTSGGSSDPTRPDRAGTAEREALRVALENESTSPETLKAKLAAVREIHAKSVAELAAAREDLKKVLTVRQEATLVSYGILE